MIQQIPLTNPDTSYAWNRNGAPSISSLVLSQYGDRVSLSAISTATERELRKVGFCELSSADMDALCAAWTEFRSTTT